MKDNCCGWLNKCLLLVFAGLGINHTALTQSLPDSSEGEFEEILIDRIELMNSRTEETEADYSDIIRDLNELKDDPVNINSAEPGDQNLLIFLTELQVFNLIAYRETYGELVSVYELQAIDGFDFQTIKNMLPLVRVTPDVPDQKIRPRRLLSYGKQRLLMRVQRVLEKREGYNSSSNPFTNYLGSPERYFLRYGFNYRNKIKLGFTAEKDPGEAFLSLKVKDTLQALLRKRIHTGFDFYSIYFYLSRSGVLKSLVLGDYQLNFGQGLTIGNGSVMSRGGNVVAIRRTREGIRPHTGSDENRFFRGSAISLSWQKLSCFLFFSRNAIDAAIDTVVNSSTGGFSSQPNFTGNHRTINELLRKNTLQVTTLGSRLSLRGDWFKVGLSTVRTEFDHLLTLSDHLYGAFGFSGNMNYNAGFDYHIMVHGVSLFGEVALARNGSAAMIHGMEVSLHPRLRVSILIRDYSRGYQNYFSNAFSAGHSYNEKGIYAGMRLLLATKLDLLAFLDIYSQPWLSYLKDRPSRGREASAVLNFRNSQDMQTSFRIRHSDRQRNNSGSIVQINPLIAIRKTGFRLQVDYNTSASVSMRNRIEYVVTQKDYSPERTGFMVYHDIRWSHKKEALSIRLRYAMFDTDTFEERIYAYEYDVLYAFSVPAYYGRGTRAVALLRVDLNRWLNVWIRAARTWYTDRNRVGTGNEAIESNAVTEIKVQAQFRIN